MLLIVLIVGALLFAGMFAVFVFGGLFKVEADQKKAENNAEAILDAAFDGREDVTFQLHMRTLKYETVIAGAKRRGYKLMHQADGQYGPHTLMFEKVVSAANES